jgi:hypothetical protein
MLSKTPIFDSDDIGAMNAAGRPLPEKRPWTMA